MCSVGCLSEGKRARKKSVRKVIVKMHLKESGAAAVSLSCIL